MSYNKKREEQALAEMEQGNYPSGRAIDSLPDCDGRYIGDEMPIEHHTEREQRAIRRTKMTLASKQDDFSLTPQTQLERMFENGRYPGVKACHTNTLALVAYGGLPLIYKEGWVLVPKSDVPQDGEECKLLMFHSWAEYEDGTKLDLTWTFPFEVVQSWSPATTPRSNRKKCLERLDRPNKTWKRGMYREHMVETHRSWWDSTRIDNVIEVLASKELLYFMDRDEWTQHDIRVCVEMVCEYAVSRRQEEDEQWRVWSFLDGLSRREQAEALNMLQNDKGMFAFEENEAC